jgi:hypothetical protein
MLAVMSAVLPQPKAIGRPPAVIDLCRVRDLAALGLSADQITDRLGISRRTLFNHMAADPAIRAAMDEGLSEAIEFAARTLFDMAREKNLGALIFWLKTKGGFNVPKEPTPTPAVIVNIGSQPAPVTLEHVHDMAERQAALLRGDWREDSRGAKRSAAAAGAFNGSARMLPIQIAGKKLRVPSTPGYGESSHRAPSPAPSPVEAKLPSSVRHAPQTRPACRPDCYLYAT